MVIAKSTHRQVGKQTSTTVKGIALVGVLIFILIIQLEVSPMGGWSGSQRDEENDIFHATVRRDKSSGSITEGSKRTILFTRKPILNPAIIVTPREVDICVSSGERIRHDWNLRSKVGPILPACPRPLNDLSMADPQFFIKNDDGHPYSYPVCPNNEALTAYDKASPFTLESTERLSWTSLSPDQHDMVWLKIVKLLMTNRGCNEVLEPWGDIKLKRELFGIVRDEYQGELSVLEWGTTCGSTSAASFLGRYFVSNRSKEVAGSDMTIRLNVLNLQETPHGLRAARHSLRKEAVLNGALAPSTIKVCPDYGGDLRWIPDETFNFVIVSQVLQRLGGSLQPIADGDDGDRPLAPEIQKALEGEVCSTLAELVRVTKVGGTIWAGHIEDQRVAQALIKCNLYPSLSRKKPIRSSPLRNTSFAVTKSALLPPPQLSTLDKGEVGSCRGYTVEMDGIGEHKWLGGKRLALPHELLAKRRPKTLLWRKVPVGSNPAVTLAEY